MLQSVVWHTRPSVLAITLDGIVTLRDCVNAISRVNALLSTEQRASCQPTHVLVDSSTRRGLAGDILNVRDLTTAAARLPAIGWIAVVDPQPNLIIRFVADSVCARLPLRYRVFTTRADACHFLQTQISLIAAHLGDRTASLTPAAAQPVSRSVPF